jgi:hypothetical protein
MYKVVWIARYPSGVAKQEASDYWSGHHGPAMKQVSPLAGYVQSHVQGPLPAVSGVAEEDAQNVFDVTQMWGAVLAENVVVPPPTGL